MQSFLIFSFGMLLLFTWSCTLFSKSENDELEKLSVDVEKSKTGIEIQIKPIEEKK